MIFFFQKCCYKTLFLLKKIQKSTSNTRALYKIIDFQSILSRVQGFNYRCRRNKPIKTKPKLVNWGIFSNITNNIIIYLNIINLKPILKIIRSANMFDIVWAFTSQPFLSLNLPIARVYAKNGTRSDLVKVEFGSLLTRYATSTRRQTLRSSSQ